MEQETKGDRWSADAWDWKGSARDRTLWKSDDDDGDVFLFS